jgi:hypothetical protein
MPVIIDEMTTQVETAPRRGSGEGEQREGGVDSKEFVKKMVETLRLEWERRERLRAH